MSSETQPPEILLADFSTNLLADLVQHAFEAHAPFRLLRLPQGTGLKNYLATATRRAPDLVVTEIPSPAIPPQLDELVELAPDTAFLGIVSNRGNPGSSLNIVQRCLHVPDGGMRQLADLAVAALAAVPGGRRPRPC